MGIIMSDFEKVHQHLVDKGYAGSGVRTITINDCEELQFIWSLFVGETHHEFLGVEYNKIRTESLVHYVTSHIQVNQPISQKVKDEFHANQFPFAVEVFSNETYTLDTDLVKQPHSAPFFINTKKLIIDGGSLTALATAIAIKADVLQVTTKSSGSNPYHIGILGVKGEDGVAGHDGEDYPHAANGRNAGVPSPGICTGASSGGSGSSGVNGTSGSNGSKAGDGVPNFPCSIEIDGISSDSNILYFFTQSGLGGVGGVGGHGGTGQQGGMGGHGCSSGCEGTNGGHAGDGGDGGLGGDGANGNPITISFPGGANRNKLSVTSDSALPGQGGAYGKGGAEGIGGHGGHGSSDGKSGSTGSFGSDGKKGAEGERTGSAGNINYNWIG